MNSVEEAAQLEVDTVKVKGKGVQPPILTKLGRKYHHDGMYDRKRSLPVYVFPWLWSRSNKIHNSVLFLA